MPASVNHIKHPIILHYLTILRDQKSDTSAFRMAMNKISTILAYHALAELPLDSMSIQTPIQETEGHKPGTDVCIIPILRAGLSLVDGIIDFVPQAKVGHLGMYRNEETHEPVNYYDNIPAGIEDAYALVVDPMLATGGSATYSIQYLKGLGATNIRFVCLIAAPEGIARVQADHPDVPIITASIDERLNDQAYIVPGLGDAGDRYFGTT